MLREVRLVRKLVAADGADVHPDVLVNSFLVSLKSRTG